MSETRAREPAAAAVVGLAVVLVGQQLAGAFVGVASGALRGLPLMLLGVFCYGAVLVAVACVGVGTRDLRNGLRLGGTAAGPVDFLLALVGFLAAGEALGAIIALLGYAEHGSLGAMNRMMAAASGAELAASLLVLAVIGGFAEELFFRGFLQPRLVAALGSARGIVSTSAAFGLVHFDWVQSPAAFVMGLLFGWLAERTGSIRFGVGIHVVNNAVAVLLPALTPMPWPRSVYLAELLVGPVVFLGCATALARRLGATQARRR
ncbi:MAG: lysostaphin resistance A-like protein [Myxococcales bacterium]